MESKRRIHKGIIADTGEQCEMRANGFWIGARGAHITSYERIDKEDGIQYSKEKCNVFHIETVD